MKDKILLEALGLKGTDRRVVAHLFWNPPEAQILSNGEQEDVLVKGKVQERIDHDSSEISCKKNKNSITRDARYISAGYQYRLILA